MEDLNHIWAIFAGTFTSLWELLSWIVGTAWNSGVSPSIPGMLGILLFVALWLSSGFAAATVAELREKNRILHMALGLAIPFIYPLAIYLMMPKCNYEKTAEELEAEKEEAKAIEAESKKVSPVKTKGIPVAEVEKSDTSRQIELPQETPAAPEKAMPAQRQEGNHRRHDPESDTLRMPRAAILQGPQTPLSLTAFDGDTANKTDQHGKPRPPQATAIASKPAFKAFDQKRFTSMAIDATGKYRGPFMIETDDGRFLEAARIISALPEVIVIEMSGEGGKVKSVRMPYTKIKDCKLKSDWLGQ